MHQRHSFLVGLVKCQGDPPKESEPGLKLRCQVAMGLKKEKRAPLGNKENKNKMKGGIQLLPSESGRKREP